MSFPICPDVLCWDIRLLVWTIIEALPDKILHSVQIIVLVDECERLGLQPHAVNHQGVVTALLVADLLVPAITIFIIITIIIIM